jgi:hypothetical protein
MADVSVEFGAKDTGLEQTLKTVQAQLTSLEEEVKSGTLSFDELQQTMRKISQAEKVQEQLQAMASGMDKAGSSASAAEPKLDALGNEATDMGNKVQGAGQQANNSAGLFDAGFAKIAAAFTVGNLAAKGFEAIVNGVFSAARAVVDAFGDALDLGGRLSDLSARTGETAGNILVLETAFKNSGLAADQVGQVINKLQNFMQDAANGGERQTKAMSNLGISLEQLAGKTPTQQMEIFAQKIAGIQDPTQRAAAASDVFGEKLGGKLLPLLLEFSPTLEDSRGKVGSLADVMDESAGTFDQAGETIDAVGEKLTAFAAGILSETLPALESLGESMEEVDAAGLGKQVGEALAPALQKLTDATSGAIEVLKMLSQAEKQAQEDTGVLGQVYNGVNESLSGFNQMMHDTFTTFTPFGRAMEYLRQKGEGLRTANDQAAEGVQSVGDAATEVAPVLDGASGSTERFATSLQDIGTDSGQAFTDINNGATEFKSLVDEGNISLSDMSGEIGGQIPLQTEQIALVGELNTSLGEANEKAGEQLAKIEEQVSAEHRRNEAIAARQEKSLADYNLQIQINEALAAGNTEQAKALEYQREHSQLTEKIMRETGLSREEAGKLAVNFIASKDAADDATESAGNLKRATTGAAGAASDAKDNFVSVRETMADIENAKLEASPQRLKERTIDARKELKDMADFIGEDLSQMELDDILDKLGLDSDSFKDKNEKLGAIEGALNDLGEADPADITPEVDTVGVNDRLEKVKEYLANVGKPDASPTIDQEAVKSAVDKAKETIDDGFTKSPVDVTLSAEESIGKIREQLKEKIDLAIESSKGTEHLSSIDKLVGKIEELVSKIEGKLPMQALAY